MKYAFILIFSLVSIVVFAQEKTEIITIAHYTKKCQGEAVQQCLMIKHQGQENWDFFFDKIEGFEFEKGFECTLKVRIYEVKNPPADGSSLKYEMVELISKVEVTKH